MTFSASEEKKTEQTFFRSRAETFFPIQLKPFLSFCNNCTRLVTKTIVCWYPWLLVRESAPSLCGFVHVLCPFPVETRSGESKKRVSHLKKAFGNALFNPLCQKRFFSKYRAVVWILCRKTGNAFWFSWWFSVRKVCSFEMGSIKGSFWKFSVWL